MQSNDISRGDVIEFDDGISIGLYSVTDIDYERDSFTLLDSRCSIIIYKGIHRLKEKGRKMHYFYEGKVYSFIYASGSSPNSLRVLFVEKHSNFESGVEGIDLEKGEYRRFRKAYISNVRELPFIRLSLDLLPKSVNVTQLLVDYRKDGNFASLVEGGKAIVYAKKPQDNKVKFSTLKHGEKFFFNGNEYIAIIPGIRIRNNSNANAAHIQSQGLAYFNSYDEVYREIV